MGRCRITFAAIAGEGALQMVIAAAADHGIRANGWPNSGYVKGPADTCGQTADIARVTRCATDSRQRLDTELLDAVRSKVVRSSQTEALR